MVRYDMVPLWNVWHLELEGTGFPISCGDHGDHEHVVSIREYGKLRESVTNLIFHQLAENDAASGMTREGYYKKLLFQDLLDGAYGTMAKEAAEMLEQLRDYPKSIVELALAGLTDGLLSGGELT